MKDAHHHNHDHHHHGPGEHDHHHHGPGEHDHDLHGASRRSLTVALVLTVGYMVIQLVGSILSGSLALLAEAAHKVTDAASIGFALAALHFSTRPASAQRTFGYRRLEILAALVNALSLWLVAGWLIMEAYERTHDAHHHVEGEVMLAFGAVGLLVNLSVAWVLHRSSKHNVNVEGAFRHVMVDLLGTVGVVVSGLLVWAFHWDHADTVVSVIIGVLILLSTWRLIGKVVHVLLEGVPKHIDVYRLCSEMEEVQGVGLIHDIHVWSLVPGYEMLTAHVLVDPEFQDLEFLRRRLREIAADDFGIHHITIQLEYTADGCTEHHHVDHLHAHSADDRIF
jgi:cobalt-zinc-cadmium efflux system protein